MKEKNEVLLFYKIYSLILLVIVIGLIFIILSSEMIKLSDSFYGALMGAVISGGSAILVFKLGELSRERERQSILEETKIRTINRLKYVNDNLLKVISNFKSRFQNGDSLNHLDILTVESYIKKLKRLTEILDDIDPNNLDPEVLEEFYKYKLNIVFVYDEMYRLFYVKNEGYRNLNYTHTILRLLNDVEGDFGYFNQYLKEKDLT